MVTLAKWSVTDYHRMIEAGVLRDRHVELLNGDIVEMSPESPFHYSLGEDGSDYLKNLLKGKAYVRFDGPITLANSEPEPDIAIVKLPREQYRQRHPYAEDIFWIIEISDSTLERDLNQKRQIYARSGIQEYWVLDIKAKEVIIFRQPQGTEYLSKIKLTQGTIAPLAFPQIEVSITQLLDPKNNF